MKLCVGEKKWINYLGDKNDMLSLCGSVERCHIGLFKRKKKKKWWWQRVWVLPFLELVRESEMCLKANFIICLSHLHQNKAWNSKFSLKLLLSSPLEPVAYFCFFVQNFSNFSPQKSSLELDDQHSWESRMGLEYFLAMQGDL